MGMLELVGEGGCAFPRRMISSQFHETTGRHGYHAQLLDYLREEGKKFETSQNNRQKTLSFFIFVSLGRWRARKSHTSTFQNLL